MEVVTFASLLFHSQFRDRSGECAPSGRCGGRAPVLPPDRTEKQGCMPPFQGLKKRREFLTVSSSHQYRTSFFVLQSLERTDTRIPPGPRFGFTVTKRLGNAVVRNRMRRRLKEAVRFAIISGVIDRRSVLRWDCVLIAKPALQNAQFDAIVLALKSGINALKRKKNLLTPVLPPMTSPGLDAAGFSFRENRGPGAISCDLSRRHRRRQASCHRPVTQGRNDEQS